MASRALLIWFLTTSLSDINLLTLSASCFIPVKHSSLLVAPQMHQDCAYHRAVAFAVTLLRDLECSY